MIPFDTSLLTTEHVYLKSCTTALGGSMTIVDIDKSMGDIEVYKKVKLPMAVGRKFIQLHGVSRYIKPVLCAVVFYDGHAVSIERHVLGAKGEEKTETFDGTIKVWESFSEQKVANELLPAVNVGQWFTDGVFVYNFSPATAKTISNMTQDGKFKSIPVDAIKFDGLSIPDSAIQVHRRTCVDFTADDGTRATSPPIWKQLKTVGDRQLDKHVDDSNGDVFDEEDEDQDLQFDRIDEFLAVNLGFALKAAKELSDVFGYDAMEPLALDELMIQLRTVNLPKTSKHVKRTFDTGMKFTHAVAWLVGLNAKVDTLDSYKVLRSLLKYLTTKGVYHKAALTNGAVYRKGMETEEIPLMTIVEALASSEEAIIANPLLTTSPRGSDHTAIGTLYGAE